MPPLLGLWLYLLSSGLIRLGVCAPLMKRHQSKAIIESSPGSVEVRFDKEEEIHSLSDSWFPFARKLAVERAKLVNQIAELDMQIIKHVLSKYDPTLSTQATNFILWQEPASSFNGSCLATVPNMSFFISQLPAGPWQDYAFNGVSCTSMHLDATSCAGNAECYWEVLMNECRPRLNMTGCQWAEAQYHADQQCASQARPCSAPDTACKSSAQYQLLPDGNCNSYCLSSASLWNIFGCQDDTAFLSNCYAHAQATSTNGLPNADALQACMSAVCPPYGAHIANTWRGNATCNALSSSGCLADRNCVWTATNGSSACSMSTVAFYPSSCASLPLLTAVLGDRCQQSTNQETCEQNGWSCTWGLGQVCNQSGACSSQPSCRRQTPDPNLERLNRIAAISKHCPGIQLVKSVAVDANLPGILMGVLLFILCSRSSSITL